MAAVLCRINVSLPELGLVGAGSPRFLSDPIDPFSRSGFSTSGPPNSCSCWSQQHSIASIPSSTCAKIDPNIQPHVPPGRKYMQIRPSLRGVRHNGGCQSLWGLREWQRHGHVNTYPSHIHREHKIRRGEHDFVRSLREARLDDVVSVREEGVRKREWEPWKENVRNIILYRLLVPGEAERTLKY